MIHVSNGQRIIGFSSKHNALYLATGSVETLESNQQYDVTFKLKNQEEIAWSFLSTLTPQLAAVKRVRLDSGKVLAHLSDIEIAKMIHYNSKELYLLVGEGTDLDSDATMKRDAILWVRYKTLVDLLLGIHLTMTAENKREKKHIGEMEIETERHDPDLSALLEYCEKRLAAAEDSLLATAGIGTNTSAGFVRASTNATYTERGTF